MMQLKTKYILLVTLMLSFFGCEKLIYDTEPESADSKVFLSVNIKAAQAKSGLRSSINTDVTAYEDNVYSLAMLIFNSSDGSRVGSVHINNSLGSGASTWAFTVELIAGRQYDFYFVANMPGMETSFSETNITDRDDMDAYLAEADRVLNYLLYNGATDIDGFPMARVYKNQLVSSGGTVYQPAPFKPKQLDTEEYSVVANASGTGAVERDYVELIRVVAKLEVELAEGTTGIGEIYFRNANQNFRLIEFNTEPASFFAPSEPSDQFDYTKLKSIDDNKYVYYMPEVINIDGTLWSEDASADNKPINYFTIVTTYGEVYDVPIISNEATITTDYLAKAKGTFLDFVPEYSIYRNHHYQYLIRINQDIEIIYQVQDWNVVNKSLFMGYGYNVEIDEEGNVTITNTIDDCMPHHVRLVALGSATFESGDGVSSDGKTVDYGYISEADYNANPDKSKTGYSEDFKINKDEVSGAYMEVYYNDVLVKTFTQ